MDTYNGHFMQTFLPYESYEQSAKVLDDKRLGKQRSECVIILKTLLGVYSKESRRGWPHHPATKMWCGYELSLTNYAEAICAEWIRRGHADTCMAWFLGRRKELLLPRVIPVDAS